MITPFLKDHIILTSKDHPNTLSIILFTDPLICNLDCYNCHNKREAKRKAISFEKMNLETAIFTVSNYKSLGVELLIISGGEPLMLYDKLVDTIKEIKKNIEIPIRIDTNGSLPDKASLLKNFVDGYGIDIKMPMKDYYTKDEEKMIKDFLKINNIYDYRDKVLSTVKIANDMKYTHLRLGYVYYCMKYSVNKEELKKIGIISV